MMVVMVDDDDGDDDGGRGVLGMVMVVVVERGVNCKNKRSRIKELNKGEKGVKEERDERIRNRIDIRKWRWRWCSVV
jgi:hypothetical protein